MECPKCNALLKTVAVKIQGAMNKAISYQCSKCDYFAFEPVTSQKIVEELQDMD